MRIIKLIDEKGGASFHQVLKTGNVQFDARPGWILLASPAGEIQQRAELHWIHPDEVKIAWDRVLD